MKHYLQNKTVIITGASGGLGLALIKCLIEKYGCTVIGVARSKEKAEKAAESLGSLADNFSYQIFDVTDRLKWREFAEHLTKRSIKPDLLINNAGIMLPFSNISIPTDAEIDEIIAVNFTAYITSVRAMLPLLFESSQPAIINICSAGGLCTVAGQGMYCATKHAIRGYTDALIAESRGIYVAGVYPGFIKSDIMRRQHIHDKEKHLISRMSMPADKAARIILRRANRGKKSIVVGTDGHLLSIAGRIMPSCTARLTAFIMRKSDLEIFKDI